MIVSDVYGEFSISSLKKFLCCFAFLVNIIRFFFTISYPRSWPIWVNLIDKFALNDLEDISSYNFEYRSVISVASFPVVTCSPKISIATSYPFLFKLATVANISSSVMPAIYGDAKIFIKLFGKKGMI